MPRAEMSTTTPSTISRLLFTAMLSGTAVPTLSGQTLPATGIARHVEGRWHADWASGVRHEPDGSLTVQRRLEAVLELEAQADSVHGTWSFQLDGRGRSIWHVRGTVSNGRLYLGTTGAEIDNPPPASQGGVSRQEWVATVDGDRMEGEHWIFLSRPGGGELESGPRPWSAVRRR